MKIDIEEEIFSQVEDVIEDSIDLVEAVAGGYFQDRFVEKTFDGNPWKKNQNPARRGSELIDTNKLRNSFLSERLPNGVRFSFGKKDVVTYAQVHNEGFDGQVVVPAHRRNTKRGVQNVREHTRRMRIPKRQFLGESEELNKVLHDEIEAYVADVLNKRK